MFAGNYFAGAHFAGILFTPIAPVVVETQECPVYDCCPDADSYYSIASQSASSSSSDYSDGFGSPTFGGTGFIPFIPVETKGTECPAYDCCPEPDGYYSITKAPTEFDSPSACGAPTFGGTGYFPISPKTEKEAECPVYDCCPDPTPYSITKQ